jgi:hypothetical protein
MSIWRTLFWKELHEHKWKMLSLLAIVVSLLVVSAIESNIEIGLVAAVYGYVFVGPIYVAMGVSSAEPASRSIAFVRALPISAWRAGVARVVVGWFVLLTPLVAALLLCELSFIFNPDSYKQFEGMQRSLHVSSAHRAALCIVAMGIGISTNLYAWILVASINQKTELRTGLVGLVTVVLLFFVSVLVINEKSPGQIGTQMDLTWLILSIGPFLWIWGSVRPENLSELWSSGLMVQLLTNAVLLTWAACRYGRLPLLNFPTWKVRQPVDSQVHSALKPPFASPERALLWMQVRESVPIALCGLAIMLMLIFIQQPSNQSEMSREISPIIGSVLALIIGIGVFVPHLQPELHTFWRSRPISPRLWFWLKYFSGAFVIAVCYDLPLLLLDRGYHSSYAVSFAFPILLHLFIYSMAVLAACGIRHAVYSGVLAIGATMAILLPPEVFQGIPTSFSFFQAWHDSTRSVGFAALWNNVMHATLLIGPLIACSALLAAWLIRRDISVSQ